MKILNIKLVFIFFIHLSNNLVIASSGNISQANNICNGRNIIRPLKGGTLIEGEQSFLILPYLERFFLLSSSDIVKQITYSKELSQFYNKSFFLDNDTNIPIELFVIGGKKAAVIYFYLLEYYKTHSYKPCQILDYAGGVVYADGVSCRWGGALNYGEEFTCSFIKYNDEGSTASDFMSLPRPRMTSGNSSEIQNSLSLQIDKYGWTQLLTDNTYVGSFEIDMVNTGEIYQDLDITHSYSSLLHMSTE
jgi:hypothetical protein